MNTPAVVTRSALTLLITCATPVLAQNNNWDVPRTSYGDPVIQGYYTNNTIVPFERSSELGNREYFTEEEMQERLLSALDGPSETEAGTAADVHYQLDDFGLSVGQKDIVESMRTSIITHPANGRLPPLLPEAQRRSDEARALSRANAFDSAQNRPLAERCIFWSHAGPPLRPISYNTTVQIMQTEDHVVLMSEMIHDSRIIPLVDERPASADLPQWQGNSWGHWDGDTLVIETMGFREEISPRGANIPMSPEGKVVERITRTGENTISYEFTVSDPALWESSWGGEYPMMLTDGPMFEYACHEGNYGIANILSGAREDERKAREAQQ